MNILVYKNYTVNDHSKWYNDRTDEGDIQNSYTQMEELSVASAEAYVQDLDEIKVFRGKPEAIIKKVLKRSESLIVGTLQIAKTSGLITIIELSSGPD